VERYNNFTLVKLKLETGRTHQIRVHMAYICHPVAGDRVYGPAKFVKELNGQCLHAAVLGFIHPVTKEHLIFESQLPDYFESFVNKLRRSV
jgi:23S rRNA pseudouridine1911/1915/1917 synthase